MIEKKQFIVPNGFYCSQHGSGFQKGENWSVLSVTLNSFPVPYHLDDSRFALKRKCQMMAGNLLLLQISCMFIAVPAPGNPVRCLLKPKDGIEIKHHLPARNQTLRNTGLYQKRNMFSHLRSLNYKLSTSAILYRNMSELYWLSLFLWRFDRNSLAKRKPHGRRRMTDFPIRRECLQSCR